MHSQCLLHHCSSSPIYNSQYQWICSANIFQIWHILRNTISASGSAIQKILRIFFVNSILVGCIIRNIGKLVQPICPKIKPLRDSPGPHKCVKCEINRLRDILFTDEDDYNTRATMIVKKLKWSCNAAFTHTYRSYCRCNFFI